MSKIDNEIYLDKEGYKKFLEDIERLKEEYKKVQAGRREAFDAGAGDGWDSPEFEEIEREERRILGQLQQKYEEKERIVIVEKHNEDEIVDVGDILLVDIMFTPDDCEEDTFKLVGGEGNLDADIQEVSLNSPLGASVYKKKIGDKCSYSVNDRNISLVIKKKLQLNMGDESQKVKTL